MKQINPPKLVPNPKEAEREKIAEDIKNYLNRGGTIKRFHHGDTSLKDSYQNQYGGGGRLARVWGKTLRNERSKKG